MIRGLYALALGMVLAACLWSFWLPVRAFAPTTRKVYAAGAGSGSGPTYSLSRLQNAIDDAAQTDACGSEILLQQDATFSGTFILRELVAATPAWDCITIRTGVDSAGFLLADSGNLSLFPDPNVRMTTGYRSVLANFIPTVNNAPSIRTVYPGETGAGCTVPCVASGWTLKTLEFLPKADWLKGKLVLFGSNAAAVDVPSSNNQNLVAEVPKYLTLTQSDLHGDATAGQHGGLYLSSADTRVTDNSFTDFKSMQETQAITECNGVGPFLIENNEIEATGENVIFGGCDSQLQQSTTIMGSPSTSSIGLTAITELFSGEYITVTHSGTEYSGLVCTLTGSICALSPVLPVTPSAGDVVKWTRMAGGLTFRLNHVYKRSEWRADVVAAPTVVTTVPSLTGGTLAAGTYWYRVAARKLMYANADADAESAAAAQVSCVIASGTTGSCAINWTVSVGSTGGTYIFGRTTGSQDKRWSVAAGVATYTDTGTAGTADTPLATGDIWQVKNNFELKHMEGASPAGPSLIEGNVFDYSWCCSQSMIVSLKVWDQDGGDVSSTVRNLTFRKNWIRHGVRGLNLTTTHAETKSSGTMTDVLIENNLFSDLSTAWGGTYSPVQITSGNYANHVGSRGGQRITIQHNTFLPDTAMDAPIWFVMTAATDTNADFIWKNNISPLQGTGAIRTYINDVGSTPGTTSWTDATSGTSVASFNVWPDASSGTYTFSTSSVFPSNAAVQAALVSYAGCLASTITSCALNGVSSYDNAASDGLDLGADIPAIKLLTDVALSGNNSAPEDPGIVDLTVRPRFSSVSSSFSSSASSLTWSHVNAGTYLRVCVAVEGSSASVSSVTFNGTPLALLASVLDISSPSRNVRGEAWYLQTPSVTTANVVVTLSGAAAVTAGAASYTGVHPLSPHGVVVTGQGDGALASVAVVANIGDLVVDCAAIRNGTTPEVIGAGQTMRLNQASGAGFGNVTGVMSDAPGATSVTMSWTVEDTTAKVWASIGVPLRGDDFAGGHAGKGKTRIRGKVL